MNSETGLEGAILEVLRVQDLNETQPNDAFWQFSEMPNEIRNLVWEHTLPGPRVIEFAYADDYPSDIWNTEDEDPSAPESYEPPILRLVGSLSTFLERDFGPRTTEARRQIEHCPHPMALNVNRQSRTCVLKDYITMQHSQTKEGTFLFNPYRDILWLSRDIARHPREIRDLVHYYGSKQLDFIQTVLVEEIEWTHNHTPTYYTANLLSIFTGIKTIIIVAGHLGHSVDNTTVVGTEEHRKRANELRARFTAENPSSTMVLKYWYIGLEGKFY